MNTNAPASCARSLALDEDMTIYHAVVQKMRLLDALDATEQLELDLSAVEQIDTAGVQLLMLVKREAEQRGKTLTISGHRPAIQQTLDFFNLIGAFGDPLVMPAGR